MDPPPNAINRLAAKQVPFTLLLPVIEPQLDKDQAMQLQGLYVQLRSGNINREEFVRKMRWLTGDHMLKMAIYKLQGQLNANPSNLPVDNHAKKEQLLGQQSNSQGVQAGHNSSDVDVVKQDQQHMAVLEHSLGLSQPSMHNNESLMSSMAYAKHAQMNDQQHKSQLSISPCQIESSKDETFEMMSSRAGLSKSTNKPETMAITALLELQNVSAGNSSLSSGSNAKTPIKKGTVGQEKPLEAPVSSLSFKEQRMATGQPPDAMIRPAGKKVPSAVLIPVIEQPLDKDIATQLKNLDVRLKLTAKPSSLPVDNMLKYKDYLDNNQIHKEYKRRNSSNVDAFTQYQQLMPFPPFPKFGSDSGPNLNISSKQQGPVQIAFSDMKKPHWESNSGLQQSAAHWQPSMHKDQSLLSFSNSAGSSSLASGSNAKTTVGQKKSLEAPVALLSKKQKVSGTFLNQSIEQLSDATAVSEVNLTAMASGSEAPEVFQLFYNSYHNICAHLDLSGKNSKEVSGMIRFLRRSKIYHAISAKPDVHRKIVNEFWLNARWNDESKSISSTVQARHVEFTEATLRKILKLQGESETDPTFISRRCIMGCFKRMKYMGRITQGGYNKKFLSIEWKYLAHVLIHCLSGRKAGYDVFNESLQMIAVSLILNKKFNVAKYLLYCMMDNIKRPLEAEKTKRQKFLMFPRFIQLIIDDAIPKDLVKGVDDVLSLDHMTDLSVKNMKIVKKDNVLPPPRRLFGFVRNVAYEAPANDNWRHDDSTEDDEPNLLVADPDVGDDDDDNDDDEAGDVYTKGKGTPEAPAVTISQTTTTQTTQTISTTTQTTLPPPVYTYSQPPLQTTPPPPPFTQPPPQTPPHQTIDPIFENIIRSSNINFDDITFSPFSTPQPQPQKTQTQTSQPQFQPQQTQTTQTQPLQPHQLNPAYIRLPSYKSTLTRPVEAMGSSSGGVFVSEDMWRQILERMDRQNQEFVEMRKRDEMRALEINAIRQREAERDAFHRQYIETSNKAYENAMALIHSMQSEMIEMKKVHQLHLDTCRQDELRLKRRDDSGDGDGGRSLEEGGTGSGAHHVGSSGT